MRIPSLIASALGPAFLTMALSACDLDALIESCAVCGEVRSAQARVVRHDIRLDTSAQSYALNNAVTTKQPVVFHVRVRMDRGGSRDFILSRSDLQVGDRVEINGDEPVARDEAARYRWM
jgi:hypothetical protein